MGEKTQPFTERCPNCNDRLIFYWGESNNTQTWICLIDNTRVIQHRIHGILRVYQKGHQSQASETSVSVSQSSGNAQPDEQAVTQCSEGLSEPPRSVENTVA